MFWWFKKKKEVVMEARILDGSLTEDGKYVLVIQVESGNLYQISKWRHLKSTLRFSVEERIPTPEPQPDSAT